MKVKDLISLLSRMPYDTEVVVAPVPNITGWTNDIQPKLSHAGDVGVLCLFEETTSDEELDIKEGLPNPVPRKPIPQVPCPKCGVANEFVLRRANEYLEGVTCNECDVEITNEDGQEGSVSQEDWETIVFEICTDRG